MTNSKKETNMVKLCVYFHTKQGDFQLPPKVAFERGAVAMPTNPKHGIRASDSKIVYFGRSQQKLMGAIKECLKNHGIKLVKEEKTSDFKNFIQMQDNEEFFDSEMNI